MGGKKIIVVVRERCRVVGVGQVWNMLGAREEGDVWSCRGRKVLLPSWFDGRRVRQLMMVLPRRMTYGE